MLRFGTDGVRGDADADLTSPLVVALGRAAARVLGVAEFLVGRDTRESGPRIEARSDARARAPRAHRSTSLGVLPTPAVAFLAQRDGVPAAIVSASHNPWTDNGVKIVTRRRPQAARRRRGGDRGRDAAHVDDADRRRSARRRRRHRAAADLDAYVAHLLGALEGRSLDGLHVVLDCANGAASELGPARVRCGAAPTSTCINAEPDGRNINAGCGSTYPDGLQRAVATPAPTLGLALDGDADRVLAADERGELVDGDQIMVMTALDWHARGVLRNDAIVVTVMSNLGLRRALGAAGVGIVETPVGDRHVVAAMAERNLAIGGEQSGHIVFADLATTGDGVLTGLHRRRPRRPPAAFRCRRWRRA